MTVATSVAPSAVPAARFFHPSNLLTYASLLAGLAAVAAATELRSGGGASAAGALLALAVLADTFDGRFARRFPRSPAMRSFGVQLDSLSDAVTFGLVPALVPYLLGAPQSTGAKLAWWAAAFVYVLCVVTRLGAYNVTHGDGSWFVGVPTPVSALVVSSALLARAGALASGLLL